MKKRGRKPTGLLRPRIIQIGLSDEENEYVARISYHNGYSASVYGRLRMLSPGWRKQLEILRKNQNGVPLANLDGRRRKD